ncbi:MAG: hypothetical protein K2V38_23390, partial [Gemmataceae bacterium]|nr:hypothetical protein [Gemmataceae bacterium]
MRQSRAITLKLLASLTLTGGSLAAVTGCGGEPQPAPEPEVAEAQPAEEPDTTWYDADGNAIPEKWKTDEQGERVLDAEGRPIPQPGVPYDRHGRPWVYHNGSWIPHLLFIHHTVGPVRTSSPWPSGSSGYRTTSTT